MAGVDTYRYQGLIERGYDFDRHGSNNAGAIGNPHSMCTAACEEQGPQVGEGAAMLKDADDKLGRKRSEGA